MTSVARAVDSLASRGSSYSATQTSLPPSAYQKPSGLIGSHKFERNCGEQHREC
jgi:hypothetical protein